jgi:branched-subunit amino acid aminotransferase/4-amino-4-deoxychorismate lyase
MPEPLAYLNGRLLPISQTTLPIYDMGIVMGASVTEMARTFHHQAFHLEQHVDRLFRSIKHVGFDVDLTRESLAELAEELIEHNSKLVPPHHDLGVSMFVTAGSSLVYLGYAGMSTHKKPTVCVHTFPLPFELWAEKFTAGQHVITPSIRHLPSECLDPKIKARSRMHWYLADEQARLVDPKAIALLLDRQDCISETGTANFFIVDDGRIITPTGRNTLHGISQKVVEELAETLDLKFETRDFQTYDVINASEAFTSSTPYCILPVTMINGRPIGTGRPGPVYGELLRAWNQRVNLDIASQMQVGAAERKAEFEAQV